MLKLSLELKFLCENIAFVLNYKYKKHNFPQLLIGHNYAHLKSGAFSLDMSIFLIWSSGSPFVWWSVTICAIFVEGITRNNSVKLF